MGSHGVGIRPIGVIMSEAYEVVVDSIERDAWLKARQSGIGASEMPAVMGESTWMSALELYAKKTSDPGTWDDDDLSASKPWIWVGQRIEGFCASLFTEMTGRETRRCGQLLRSKKYPWALATLDCEFLDRCGEWIPLEIKNVSGFKSSDWTDGPPEQYRIQMHQQMLVTGAQKSAIFALIGGNHPVWSYVHRDDALIERIVSHGERFWGLVESGTPPEPDGSQSASKAISAMYPDHTSDCVHLGGEHVSIADEIESLKSKEKECRSRIRELEQRVRLDIGRASIAVLPDGRSWSVSTVSRKETTIKASSYTKMTLKKARK